MINLTHPVVSTSALTLTLLACSAADNEDRDAPGPMNMGGDTFTGNGGGLDTGNGDNNMGSLDIMPDEPPVTTGQESICDGIDDDGNGIVDDVDVAGDGICDCVSVATIGSIGPWGMGNVFADWLTQRSTNGATHLGNQELTPELLEPFDVIIQLNVHTEPTGPSVAFIPVAGPPPPPPSADPLPAGAAYHALSPSEVEAMRGWVDAGGGLMTTVGYHWDQEIVNPNLLLAPYGIEYVPGDVLAGGLGGSLPVNEFPGHPISTGVQAVGMNQGKALIGNGQIVATGAGLTLGMTAEHGLGKVFAWGDEWITHDRDWIMMTGFQVELFWVNILGYLTPATECTVPVPPELLPR